MKIEKNICSGRRARNRQLQTGAEAPFLLCGRLQEPEEAAKKQGMASERLAGAKAQSLFSGIFGPTEVGPCYKASVPLSFSAACEAPCSLRSVLALGEHLLDAS